MRTKVSNLGVFTHRSMTLMWVGLINGFMTDVGLWSDLREGTRLIDGMSMIDLSDQEIESIDQIENIEFNLRVVDANTWEDIVVTDPMTLSFE